MAEGCSNFDSEIVPVSECIPPLRVVCVDNETFDDCTLLRVEGENWHGILLQIVQALSDLDLIISKSSISANSGWFMVVFHVTDHHGHKVRDPSFIRYMQRSLDRDQEGNGSSSDIAQLKICHDNKVNVEHFTSDCIALEISSVDCPGILSEVTAVLSELSCMVDTGEVWTHNGCTASILYIKDRDTGQSISERKRLSCLLKRISTVVKAHHLPDKLSGVRLRPTASRIHTERRLHQLMQEHMDYQVTPPPSHANEDLSMLAISVVEASKRFGGNCKGKEVAWSLDTDYFVVTVRSRDTPKLMFDTMCALTDLNYDVLRGSISSYGRWAIQEYSLRGLDGCGMLNEVEKQSLVRSLKAAIERRQPQGLRLEMRTLDQPDLLLNVSKVFQQNGLSINKAEFAKQKDLAVGTFYVTDASSSSNIDAIDEQKLEAMRKKIEDGIFFENKNDYDYNTISPAHKRWSLYSTICSFGCAIWSHIKRLFSIFPRFH